MIAPLMILFFIFFVAGFIASIAISLTSWNLLSPPAFVGLDNYTYLTADPKFLNAVGNTLKFVALYVPLNLVVALFLALAIQRMRTARGILRAMFLLPLVTTSVASGVVWKWLYDPTFGPINGALSAIGIHGPAWLADPRTVLPAIVLMLVWNGVGQYMVILMAGLQGIPQDVLEAAQVDGASSWQQLRHITLPLLAPITFFVTVVTTMSAFQVFDAIYVMTGGGPSGETTTVVYYLYQEAFRNFRIGYASAMTWVLFILILGFTLVQFRLQRRWVYYA